MAVFDDQVALVAIHIALALTLIVALVATFRVKLTRGIAAKVIRGETSMNALYVMYGTVTLVFALALEMADTAVGYKSTLLMTDYGVLSYLFWGNSWFRNRLIETFIRLRED